MNFIERIFGTHSERELRIIDPTIDKIESLRPTMMAMSDEELRELTPKFKQRLAEGEILLMTCRYFFIRNYGFIPKLHFAAFR